MRIVLVVITLILATCTYIKVQNEGEGSVDISVDKQLPGLPQPRRGP